jgi:hypothetical protein
MDTYYSETVRIARQLQEIADATNTSKACQEMKKGKKKFFLKNIYPFKTKKDMEKLRENLWMIEFLTVEAMIKRPTHFLELFKQCGLPRIEPNDEMSFQLLLDYQLERHRATIEEVSRTAEKEWNLEKKLNEVYDKFKELQLEIIAYK